MLEGNAATSSDLDMESSNLFGGYKKKEEIKQLKPRRKCFIKTRTILWLVIFWGFIMNYMIRCNTNIAIVSMLMPREATNNTNSISNCFNHSAVSLFHNFSANFLKSNEMKSKGVSIERLIMDLFKLKYNENGFEWNEYEQNLFLGSFYWLSWATQIPGGVLAKRHGTKLVFGIANFLTCVTSSLIPIAAYMNFYALITVRVIQGILSGFTWPAIHHLISLWVPPDERCRFITVYLGGSVGLAIFYPVFGFILSIASWEWIFHFCTLSGIVWFIFWQYFIYDSPSENPHIDLDELNYITDSLGDSVHKDDKAPIPWKQMFLSVPVWVNIIAEWGGVWATYTLIIQLPTYFKSIHGLNPQTAGLLSGIPHILRMTMSYVLSLYLDNLLGNKKMTTTNVRKIAVFFSCIVCGILTIGLAFAGCDFIMAIVLISLSLASLGGMTAGPLTGMLEMAPNFSSILLGIKLTICIFPSIISPYIVGVLTLNNQTTQQWKYVFLISAAVSIITGIVYIIFGSSKEKSWNRSSNVRETAKLTAVKGGRKKT